jgi:hypothetical protein
VKLCRGSARSEKSISGEKILRKNPCKVCIGPTLSWNVGESKSGECKKCTKISQENPKS